MHVATAGEVWVVAGRVLCGWLARGAEALPDAAHGVVVLGGSGGKNPPFGVVQATVDEVA
jgi:hypothetical protein